MMITIVAKCRLKDGKKDAFLAAASELVKGSRHEVGNISYHLYQDLQKESVMTFIEVWRDQEAIDEHNASNHFQAACAKFTDCLEGGLEVNLYKDSGI